MATHTILSQYAEWLLMLKSWASQQTRLDIFVICLGAWVVYSIGVYTYRLFFHPLSKYPGPRFAAASYMYEMYHDIVKEDQTWNAIKLHEKYGPIVRISPNKVRLRKSSAWHEVHRMGSPLLKDPAFYQLFGLPGSTFATCDPVQHRKQRRALDPMFSRRSIMELEDVVQSKVNFLCSRMKEIEAQNGIVHFYNAFVALTTDIITDYAYGKSYNTLSGKDFHSQLFDAFDAQHEVFMVLKSFPLLSTILQNLPPWLLMKVFPNGAGFRELEVDAEAQLKLLFENKKNGGKKLARRTVFEEVLDNHPDPQNASEKEFVQEATSVVGAGMHTTRWILSLGTLRVAQNPEIVAKLVQELKQAIPNVEDSLSYRDLENLPYLRGVVNESLRLGYGVINGNSRVAPAKGAVIGGYHLPGGSAIVMDHYSISHDEEIFPDSWNFSPDRWLGPNAKSNEKYVVAFGAGTRQCLGVNLAYCELYVMFAYLFRRFEVDVTGKDIKWADHWMPILRSEPLACKVKSRLD